MIVGALIHEQVRTFLASFIILCRTHIAGLVFLYGIEMQDTKNQNFLGVLKVIGFDYINSSEKFLSKKDGMSLQGPR